MKIFYYLAIGLLILSCAGLFVLKRPDGGAWLNLTDIITPIQTKVQMLQSDVVNKTRKSTSSVGEQQPKTVEVFRWQDENGEWHFSDKIGSNIKGSDKNSASSNVQKIAIKTTNVMSIKVEQVNNKQIHGKKPEQSPPNKLLQSSLSKIPTLIEDAQNVQTLMDERTKQLDKAIEQR
ncbi:hypothetical protein A9Q74_09465 [Colwellia sp. 39_35_sub15_T18]|nr:hypothetical protein A9Q74_09465 [Colwellia sp. 39_35_sub15_T18]